MLQSNKNIVVSTELFKLRNDLLQIEKRIDAVRGLIRTAEMEVLRQNDQSLVPPQDELVARIVDGVSSRLTATPKHANRESKPYLREKEAAQYMGVSVFALRSWRTKRSNNGPPYTRLGRIVLYRVSEIDEHMRTRMVQQAMVRSA